MEATQQRLQQYVQMIENQQLDLEDDEAVVSHAVALDAARTSTMDHFVTRLVARSAEALDRFGMFALICGAFALAFLALAMLFEVLYPFDSDPEVLYNTSKVSLLYIQDYYDLVMSALNLMINVVQPFIPFWNSVSNYMVEPMVFIGVEILSKLINFGDPYAFYLMSNAGNEFYGYDCQASDVPPDNPAAPFTAQAWCGLHGFYKTGITAFYTAGEWNMRNPTDGTIAGSRARVRLLRQMTNDHFALPYESARRLTVDTGVPTLATASMNEVVRVVAHLTGYIIELFGMVLDLVMHALYIILDDLLPIIGNMMIQLITIVSEVFLTLVRSGVLQRVLGALLDLIMIFFFDIAIPAIFAILDAIMCLLHLFDPASWHDELKCAHSPPLRPSPLPYHLLPSLEQVHLRQLL
jgi:hypothetical protein